MSETETKQDNRQPNVASTAIYLMSCTLNGLAPSPNRLEPIEASDSFSEGLIQFCRAHFVSTLCALALKSTDMFTPAWERKLAADEYHRALQDIERDAVFAQLEEHHLRYLPLKGSVLSLLYPSPLMREMCDCDILVDSTVGREVHDLMLSLGYEFGQDSPCHANYLKQPFINFEMHRQLFEEVNLPEAARYFHDVWSVAAPDEGGRYRYHLCPTDFYIYMVLHAYKHYAGAGFGLRTLADEVMMLRKLGDIDFERVADAMTRLGTQRFETTLRGLSQKLFDRTLLKDDGQPLYDAVLGGSELFDDAEMRMLTHTVASGAYGTIAQSIERRIVKSTGAGIDEDEDLQIGPADKARYILGRVFPPAKELSPGWPVLGHPAGKAFLPGIYAYRIVRNLTVRRNSTALELRELKKVSR